MNWTLKEMSQASLTRAGKALEAPNPWASVSDHGKLGASQAKLFSLIKLTCVHFFDGTATGRS
jgi:hypothetical protein